MTVDPRPVGPQWKRVIISGQAVSSADEYEVGIELPPGEEITLFGFQLEAQPTPSGYKMNLDTTGVHTRCRFLDDEIVWRIEDVDSNRTTLRVVSL